MRAFSCWITAVLVLVTTGAGAAEPAGWVSDSREAARRLGNQLIGRADPGPGDLAGRSYPGLPGTRAAHRGRTGRTSRRARRADRVANAQLSQRATRLAKTCARVVRQPPGGRSQPDFTRIHRNGRVGRGDGATMDEAHHDRTTVPAVPRPRACTRYRGGAGRGVPRGPGNRIPGRGNARGVLCGLARTDKTVMPRQAGEAAQSPRSGTPLAVGAARGNPAAVVVPDGILCAPTEAR